MVAGLREDERHALAQTIAAERLEGWRPSTEQVAGLTELLTGAVTFGEYLGRHLPTDRRRLRRPVLARRKPYLIPGTTVLRNNFGVHDVATLTRLEFVATAGRILQVHMDPESYGLDVRRLHQHVFGDVYAWAGEPRIVELRRGEAAFGSCERIPGALETLGVEITSVAVGGASLDGGELAYRLARIYADYNQIHPFREGNGRTGTLLLHVLAARAGQRLCLDRFTREDWITASRDSMPFRRDGLADPRPFLAVLRHCLRHD
ncbi:Fic/DOC family protein [Mycolicibacterium sp. XJ870]